LNQVSNRGLTLNERGDTLLEFAIADGEALVLPEVLSS
jgi:hypothetical protein